MDDFVKKQGIRAPFMKMYSLIPLFITLIGVLGACASESKPKPTPITFSFGTITPVSTRAAVSTATATTAPDDISPPTATATALSTATDIPPPTPTFTPTATPSPTVTLTPQPSATLTPTPAPDRDPPSIPQITRPINGERFECETGRDTRVVRLEFSPSSDPSGVARYEVQIQPRSYKEIEFNVQETYMVIDATCGKEYSWSVNAMDREGNRSEWSPKNKFSVVLPDQNPPTKPTLVSPPNNDAIICNKGETKTITFEWNAATDADSGLAGYYFYIQQEGQNWSPASELLKIQSFTQRVTCGYWYAWVVKSVDNRENTNTSNLYKLYVGPDIWPPNKPQLDTPSSNQQLSCPGFYREVQFTWKRLQDSIDRYYIEIRKVYGQGDTVIVHRKETSDTSITLFELECGLVYDWRVVAVDQSENVGDWSSWRRLTIE
ncbi:MAG: hypothetical protein KDJ52_21610 [Anaerolineae bacterium]|nr:hypothetical protein [Anaerolineae bacterium]